MRAVAHGVGQPVRRKEDWRLLNRTGLLVDGAGEPGACGDLRSPHALVWLVLVDTRAARMPPRLTSSRAHQELG